MAGELRLPIGITAALIAIAIIVLVVTEVREDHDALTGNEASQEEPTASPWLALPEWVASSPEALIEFYFTGSVLDVATGKVWHVTAPGRTPYGEQRVVGVDFLGWTPRSEALIGVGGAGRTALYIGKPGGELRHWITIDSSNIRRIDVRWSPDGDLIAIGDLIVDATTGETVKVLMPGSPIGWSADSRLFAVATASEDNPSVIAWDRETGLIEEIPLATSGVWSGLGHRLAYATERPEATEPRLNQILVGDIAGGANGAVSVLSELMGYNATPVAWSSSSDYLVVEVSTRPIGEGGVPEHHIIDLGTGVTIAVIEGAWLPRWSPADDTLVFIGNICSGFDIFTVQADGTALTDHTESAELDLWPRWSPDGESIVHTAYREDRVTLVITSIAEGTGRTVLSLPFDALSPLAWSPDSSYITFRWGGGRGLCEGEFTERQETKVRLPD